jgi:hypothetical protein
VYNVGDEIDRLYFPTRGIASLQVVMNGGRAIDTAMVGRDGALGATAAYAPCRAAARCVVRSTITAFTISALEYRHAAASEVALQMLIIQYQDTLLYQTHGVHGHSLLNSALGGTEAFGNGAAHHTRCDYSDNWLHGRLLFRWGGLTARFRRGPEAVKRR